MLNLHHMSTTSDYNAVLLTWDTGF